MQGKYWTTMLEELPVKGNLTGEFMFPTNNDNTSTGRIYYTGIHFYAEDY